MKKNEEAAAKKKPKTSAAQIRVQKGASYFVRVELHVDVNVLSVDLTELDLPSTMTTHFPDPADLLNFTLTITPDEGTVMFLSTYATVSLYLYRSGMYKGGAFVFSFVINPNYPHDPPKVKCTQTVRPIATSVLLSLSLCFVTDLPSKRRPRGERLSEHSARGLEASAELELGDGGAAVSILGAKRRRSIE